MPAPKIDPLRTRAALDFKYGSPLIGCRFDPSGRFLFVSAQDNTIQRFDVITGERTPLIGHAGWVRGLAFVADKPRISPVRHAAMPALLGGASVAPAAATPVAPFTLLSADYHGKLIWWSGHDDAPKPLRSIDAHDGWVRAVAVSPDGQSIATCGNDNFVRQWSVGSGKLLRTFASHDSHVYNVAFHPDGANLVSADLKGVVRDWNLATGQLVREIDAKSFHKYDGGFMADIGGVRGMAFDAAGKTLACTGITNVSNAFAGVGNPHVVLFDWMTGKAKPLAPKEAFQGTGWGVTILDSGFVLAAGGNNKGRVWFWKLDDGVNVHSFNVAANVRDLALHPDGTAFATAGANGTATLFSMV